MNKFLANCRDFINEQHDSKENLVQDIYNKWLIQSIESKLSWCRGESHLKEGFSSEMKAKLEDLMPDEMLSFITYTKPVRKPRPVRSKKKRIRSKRQKLERQMRSS